jgi:SWI/SNF-related matrix-associated actin-dependent regulator of chromatin subfamily A member 5
MGDPDYDPMNEDASEGKQEKEETAPEDDFLEADATGSISEDDEGLTVEYNSDEEEEEEVRLMSLIQDVQSSDLHPYFQKLNPDIFPFQTQELEDEAAKLIAKKEKERLRLQEKSRRDQVEKMRSQLNADAEKGEAARGKRRLDFLLKQAEVFQHFVPDNAEAEGKKKRGRHSASYTEEMEDEELLRDEEDEGERAGHRLQVQPSVITGGKMREYQLQGLNWLIHLYDNGINGILADEMGLGKTLQTISLLGYLREFRRITGPHMVIVPKSTLHNWLNEFKRWCPSIKAVKFHGNAEQRQQQKDNILQPGKFDVVVTSYEMVIKEKNHWKKFHWRYIIIDEAHRIKNENSLLSRVVRMLKTNYRLLITGTPLQNNLHELWALLNFLLPEVFSSAEKFDEWFQMSNDNKEGEAEVVQQLHKVLRPFLLRRLKSDVEKSLPPKKETILKIGMSDMQRKYYAALLQKDVDAITGGAERSRLLNIVMQLRKCCNHPYLFQGAEPGPPYFAGEHLVENSGKLVLLDKLLPKLKSRGSRVLVFSQMTRMIDILEDYCQYRGHQYCRIDGNTTGEDRESQIDEYNREGSEKFLFLLSTRAGGLGINLYTADIVVLYDSDWNPQMDLQAMDRAHRIGQKKEVQVFRFCTENSIEEKVIEKAYKKLRLDALVIQQGRLVENSKSKVNKDELLNMVRYGAELVFSSEASKITDADIDAIIAKGEASTKELNDKLQDFTNDAMKFTMDGGISAYDFEGEKEVENVDQVDQLKALMGANWVDPPKRERKRVVSYAEGHHKQREGGGQRQGGPRRSKMPVLHDFQFFDNVRITFLYDKEDAYNMFQHSKTQREAAARQQGASEEVIAKELAPSEDDPQPLTEDEIAERDQLLKQGFSNWSKRDFQAFVRACARWGRRDLDNIYKDIDGKTDEEIKSYAKVFWERFSELNESDKWIKQIEAGEQKIQRQQDIMRALASKMSKSKNPWQDLKINYGPAKGKAYTEEEDRFLICMMHKLGYGAWEEIKAEVRNHWRFRFDWFFKSRTPNELQRRCETLIRLIEKENEEDEERAQVVRKRGPNKKKNGATTTGGEEEDGKKRKGSETNNITAGGPPVKKSKDSGNI